MKNIVIIFVLLLGNFFSQAQLQITTNQSATQLVQNTLIGYGVTVSNISFTGGAMQLGKFTNGGTSNVGFLSGIILSSGKVVDAVGPNSSGSTGTNTNGTSDPQLAALVTGTVNDAAALEFDFVPIADTLKFKYVFGSDEYPEFSTSNYNDVFGFFISGPNPNGGQYVNKNMAIIPNTANTPVSINNINNGLSNNGPCTNCSYYIDNTGGLTVEYDGMTVVMTAWTVVSPCNTYHFKAAIGDVGDHIYDSGVFLEANSFLSTAVQISTKFSVAGAWPVGLEGCNDANIKAKIPKALNYPFVVLIDTMWGSATNGIDFSYIPDSILIPAGQKSASITLSPIADHVAEGQEDWNFKFSTSPCTVDTVSIKIDDYSPILAPHISDTAVCSDTATLWVKPTYGIQPYYYDWQPAASIINNGQPTVKAMPAQTTTYIVQVTDTTGCPPVIDTILVEVNPKASASFLPDKFKGCEGLDVLFSDMSYPNITQWLWDFGDGSTSNQQSPNHTYSAGKYSVNLKVTTDKNCSDEITVLNLIEAFPTPIASFEAHPPVVAIDHPSVDFVNFSKKSTQYDWNFGEPGSTSNTSTMTDPTHVYGSDGDFVVWLIARSDEGCVDSVSHQVQVIIDEITIPNVITPNGDGHNDVLNIENIDKLEWSNLRIYNRWGKLIFQSNNYQNDWDGNGAADGVYFYILDYKTYFRSDKAEGTITIIR